MAYFDVRRRRLRGRTRSAPLGSVFEKRIVRGPLCSFDEHVIREQMSSDSRQQSVGPSGSAFLFFGLSKLESLILAQNERWRRA